MPRYGAIIHRTTRMSAAFNADNRYDAIQRIMYLAEYEQDRLKIQVVSDIIDVVEIDEPGSKSSA